MVDRTLVKQIEKLDQIAEARQRRATDEAREPQASMFR